MCDSEIIHVVTIDSIVVLKIGEKECVIRISDTYLARVSDTDKMTELCIWVLNDTHYTLPTWLQCLKVTSK